MEIVQIHDNGTCFGDSEAENRPCRANQVASWLLGVLEMETELSVGLFDGEMEEITRSGGGVDGVQIARIHLRCGITQWNQASCRWR